MSLLTIVENVCDEIAIQKPTSVIASTESNAIQMLALANRGGKVLARRRKGNVGWAVLTRLETITTINGTAGYALPSDFGQLVDNTLWDRTNFWKLRGPLTPAQWQVFKSGILAGSTGPRRRVRITRASATNVKQIEIDPVPTSADTLVYEYVSNGWCQTGTDAKTAWSADTDTAILLEDLLEMDLKWRMLKAKGREYADDFKEFELEVAQELSADDGSPILNLSGRSDALLISDANLPEANFPSV